MVNIPIAQQEFPLTELHSQCESLENRAPKKKHCLSARKRVLVSIFIGAMLHQLAARAGYDFANLLYDYGPATIKLIIRLILLWYGHTDPSLEPLMPC